MYTQIIKVIKGCQQTNRDILAKTKGLCFYITELVLK